MRSTEKQARQTRLHTCISELEVIQLLEKLVEQTDNDLDDKAVQIVKKGLDIT